MERLIQDFPITPQNRPPLTVRNRNDVKLTFNASKQTKNSVH